MGDESYNFLQDVNQRAKEERQRIADKAGITVEEFDRRVCSFLSAKADEIRAQRRAKLYLVDLQGYSSDG